MSARIINVEYPGQIILVSGVAMNLAKILASSWYVFWLVDNEKKPTMGYIYEAIDRAKEAITKLFGENEDQYKAVFDIIDRR